MAKYQLHISEYGKEVRTYTDDDILRFLKQTKEIITQHLEGAPFQHQRDVKNIRIHIFTNE